MLTGNIADFTRSVRNFHDSAPNLSGNLGGSANHDIANRTSEFFSSLLMLPIDLVQPWDWQ